MGRRERREGEKPDPKSVFEIMGADEGLLRKLPPDVLRDNWKTLQGALGNRIHAVRKDEINERLGLIEEQLGKQVVQELRTEIARVEAPPTPPPTDDKPDLPLDSENRQPAPPDSRTASVSSVTKQPSIDFTEEELRAILGDDYDVFVQASNPEAESQTATPKSVDNSLDTAVRDAVKGGEQESETPTTKEQQLRNRLVREALDDLPEDLASSLKDQVVALRALLEQPKPAKLSQEETEAMWKDLVSVYLARTRAVPEPGELLAENLSEAYHQYLENVRTINVQEDAHALRTIALKDSAEAALELMKRIEERAQDTSATALKILDDDGQVVSLEDMKREFHTDLALHIRDLKDELKRSGANDVILPPALLMTPDAKHFEQSIRDLVSSWEHFRFRKKKLNQETPPDSDTSKAAMATDELPTPPPFDEDSFEPVNPDASAPPVEEKELSQSARRALAMAQELLLYPDEVIPAEAKNNLQPYIDRLHSSPDNTLHEEFLRNQIVFSIRQSCWFRNVRIDQPLIEMMNENIAHAAATDKAFYLTNTGSDLAALAISGKIEETLTYLRQIGERKESGETNIRSLDDTADHPLEDLQKACLEEVRRSINRWAARLSLEKNKHVALFLDEPLEAEGYSSFDEFAAILTQQAEWASRVREAWVAELSTTTQSVEPAPAPDISDPTPASPPESSLEPIPTPDSPTPSPDLSPEPTPDITPEPAEPEVRPDTLPPLEDVRAAYAVALRRRSRIINATSDGELERLQAQYAEALKFDRRSKIDELRTRFEGANLNDPATAQQVNSEIAGIVMELYLKEEDDFRLDMRDKASKTRFEKFKGWWLRNSGIRLAAGAALTLGGVTGILTGGTVVGGGLLLARVAMSAGGGFMSSESYWQKLREKFGSTKQLTAAQAENLSDTDLREAFAAHSFRYADQGTRFLERRTGFRGKNIDRTGAILQSELLKRETARLQNLYQEGQRLEAIISGALNESLTQESELHNLYRERRQKDQRDARLKFATATAIGLAAGLFTYDSATGHSVKSLFKKIFEHADSDTGVSGSADILTKESVSSSAAPDAIRPPASDLGTQTTESIEPDTSGTLSSVEEFRRGPIVPDTATPEAAAGIRATAGTTVEHTVNSVETVHKGDTVWSLIEHQLKERLGNQYEALNEAQRTYLIDGIKDDIVSRPQDFGLQSPDIINVNQTIDFSQAFDADHAARVQELLGRAKGLSQEALQNIEAHNNTLTEWADTHPGEALTDEKIDLILHGIKAEDLDIEEAFGSSAADVQREFLEHMRQTNLERNLDYWQDHNPELYEKYKHLLPTETTQASAESIVSSASEASVPTETTSETIQLRPEAGPLTLDQDNLRNAMYQDLAKMNRQLGGDSHLVLKEVENLKIKDVLTEGKISEIVQKHGSAELGSRVEKSMREFFRSLNSVVQPDNTVKEAMEAINKRPNT